jgi:gluconate 2-dehydrogenase alpha chain
MGPCNFCGFCGGFGCYMYSKASPNVNILPALRQKPNFELRANAHVLRVNLDSTGRKARGVTYVDAQGREIQQAADLVILSAFQFHNVRLMLLSGIGKPYDVATGHGTVGRNFAYQNMGTVKAFFGPDVHTNPFIGTGGGGQAIDDFNADNFDHGPLGFVGGSPCWVNQSGVKPIGGLALPDGTPHWGAAWKKAAKDYYAHTLSADAHGTNMAYRDCYLDLDPTYRDAYGQKLLRMTFDWKDNDIRMSRYVVGKLTEILRSMNPRRSPSASKSRATISIPAPIKRRISSVARSWAAIPTPAPATNTCRAGTCRMFSSSARRHSRRGLATIRPAWWRRWPISRRMPSARSI